jgi:lipopolysaccharide transport system permease protein
MESLEIVSTEIAVDAHCAAAPPRGSIDSQYVHAADPHADNHATPNEAIIRADGGWPLIDLPGLWRARDLLWMLALRDLKVRYKQTVIGAAWAIIQPLLTMTIFYVLFRLMRSEPVSSGLPYILSTYSALLVWQLFATSLLRASSSLVDNQALLKKVYCPRLVFPLAPTIVALVDFAIACVLLAGLMLWYHRVPGWPLAAAPLLILLTITTAWAFGIWFAALAAMYRDFMFVVPFMTQIWLWLTPVLYETGKVIPEKWRFAYFLNPMAGIVEGFRWSLFGTGNVSVPHMMISLVVVVVLLVTGLMYFSRVEETLADWV